jgi:hypothetical protein
MLHMTEIELDLSALIDHLQNAINDFLQIQFDDFPRLSLVCFGLLQSSYSFAGFSDSHSMSPAA